MGFSQVVPRLLIKRAFESNLKIVDYGIERRADLVRLVGKEQLCESTTPGFGFSQLPGLDELSCYVTISNSPSTPECGL